MMMMMTMKTNLLAPCQQLTSTLAFGLLAKLDRIHIPWQSYCHREAIKNQKIDFVPTSGIGIQSDNFS